MCQAQTGWLARDEVPYEKIGEVEWQWHDNHKVETAIPYVLALKTGTAYTCLRGSAKIMRKGGYCPQGDEWVSKNLGLNDIQFRFMRPI